MTRNAASNGGTQATHRTNNKPRLLATTDRRLVYAPCSALNPAATAADAAPRAASKAAAPRASPDANSASGPRRRDKTTAETANTKPPTPATNATIGRASVTWNDLNHAASRNQTAMAASTGVNATKLARADDSWMGDGMSNLTFALSRLPKAGRLERGVSNCLQSQADFAGATCRAASHIAWSRSIALRIVSSLRIAATMATFFGLPAASSRS